jgi:hypothetical protein
MLFPCDASSVPAARHFVVQTLTAWGSDDAAWAAAQVVSELAGNCSLHARTDFTVRLLGEGAALRLEVRDGSPGSVRPRRYGARSTTGRGLRLVESLADSWGVEASPLGKTVWVTLRAGGEASAWSLDEGLDEGQMDVDALLAAFPDEGEGASAQAVWLPVAA